MSFRVVVDFDRCESNALCMAAAPEVFEVRDDDFLYVLDEQPPEALRDKCLEAARVCPKQAISIVDESRVSDLAGMAALVTGGGSGIGLGAAKRLAADGAHVTIAGRTEARLAEAVDEIHAVATDTGASVQYAVCDVTVEDDVRQAVTHASAPTGGLDVLFACAGGSLHLGPILAADLDQWKATLELNVVGTFLSMKHAGAAIAASGGGSIIAMSSIAGHSTHRLMSAYCVGKAGIEMLVKVAADELGEQGVRVNAVQPGLVDTDLVGFITAGGKLLDDYLDQMPVARVGTVDDIASVVRFLAGPESTWITGQMIGIDGGHQLRRGPRYNLLFE